MCFLSSSEPPHTSLRSILGNHLRYCTEIDFQVIRQERGGYEERLIREMKKNPRVASYLCVTFDSRAVVRLWMIWFQFAKKKIDVGQMWVMVRKVWRSINRSKDTSSVHHAGGLLPWSTSSWLVSFLKLLRKISGWSVDHNLDTLVPVDSWSSISSKR